MNKPLFENITDRLISETKTVSRGKLMSCDAITYKKKVFAAFYKDEMIFRLGKGYDIQGQGVKKFKLLQPFKTKPPMSGWFVVPSSERNTWEALAREGMRTLIGEVT